ncbi:MAG TPA: glycosyltransferase family 4 protein [Polyangiaceae bacterium]|nr:glycosyltransferase family 4 protein [Polyangiaceae bacterium]
MRIVLVNRLLDRPGGEQLQLVQLARRLSGRGHQVHVITGYYDAAACYPRHLEGLDVRAVHGSRRADGSRSASIFGRTLQHVAFRKRERDLGQSMARLFPADIDLVNWHGALPQPTWNAMHSSGSEVPWVWMCNDLPAPFYQLAALRRGEDKTQLAVQVAKSLPRQLLTQVSVRNPPGIITVLDEDNRWWWRRVLGRDAVRVPWGLEHSTDPVTPTERKPEEPFRLFAAGIIGPLRRFHETIEAVALARSRGLNVTFDICGEPSDPAYVASLQARIDHHRLNDEIKIHGYLPYAEYLALRARCHAMVLTMYGQTWGQVATESVWSGLAAVLNDTATTLEVLPDGEASLVFKSGDPESLCAAIDRLYRDEALRCRLVRQAQSIVRLFSWDRYVDAMEDLFVRVRGRSKLAK